MDRIAKWCLKMSYFYGRVTGVLNFEIDLRTGRPEVTRRATIWAAGLHSVMFVLLIYHSMTRNVMSNTWKSANYLHEYVFMVIASFRIVCVLLALLSRWSQRRTFIRIFNSFHRLFQHNPDIIKYCHRSIVSKCLCVTMVETLQLIVILALMGNRLTLFLGLRIWAISCLTAIMNVIITQFFIAMAIIRGRYILINKDLQAIIAETQALVPNGSGLFGSKSCLLADRLERIARSQSDLQELIEQLSKAYQGEVVCMSISYYLNAVGSVYLLFSLHKYGGSTDNWPMLITVSSAAYFLFYYLDCWLNCFNVFYLLDTHNNMVKLVSKWTLFQPGLDSTLESAFDNFNLNLARNPLKLQFYGLFEIDRVSSFALGNSLLTHSLLLIQYDIEHT
ncbi:putative gustatory receptor 59d [Drosophila eugracilis]|uniref:putative gustatory receptor 59d n=1 Tax=Drosophila eugracilis TaxID=29029 RepID=UPI001BDB2D2C|nr:putative gustatory receptor 59d [Drosophila eugracilis]